MVCRSIWCTTVIIFVLTFAGACVREVIRRLVP
jgi:hypothetical protein